MSDDHPHYVRRFNKWVPESPPAPRTPWRTRWAAAHPMFRFFVLAGIVLIATALIVYMSLAAGDAAVDGYGPLIPVTPSPTPFPNGWTP